MPRAKRFIAFALLFALFLGGCSGTRDSGLTEKQIEKLVRAARPNNPSPDIWAKAIQESLEELGQPVDKEHVSAVVAVISQVSGFSISQKNSRMATILRKKIESAESNEVLRFIIETRLDQKASNGRTFRENIDSIESELDFERWYDGFTSATITKPILLVLNKDASDLVTTIGSMQVSVKFAEEYPKKPRNVGFGSVRDMLYTCKGGVFYGTAYLLDFKHDYDDWKYVFADFNAGHYSSRNAGFQKMLAKLTHRTVAMDGDLMSYENGNIASSVTYATFIGFLKKKGVGFDENQVKKDFSKEKSHDFENTWSYKTIAKMHKERFGRTIYATLPDIPLKSEKFSSRNLSTKWFAQRVKSRFNHCMRTRI
ncbi:MAG: DUF1615 family protein [Chlorobium limicola]|uniref:Lipoprotein n=1 Tax=Chlorobium limicola (strain DSM 245 / NBRC 103803 / 6330) TaxID=290315 RepID=B3EDB7_CHLL2|nr:DUF1615 family protein [Chlorobium limicola]ACD90542.1 conserved hypothetical protein [Chlorobium limicola DSM 245]NTV21769.1 DUF1615 family protein [Chlorobium limicola]